MSSGERHAEILARLAAASIGEVSEVVGNMELLVQQSAAAAEETAAASDSMKMQANTLVRLMSGFTVGGEGRRLEQILDYGAAGQGRHAH